MKPLAALALAFTFCASGARAGELPDSLVEKTLGVSGVKHEKVTKTQQGMTYSDVEYKTQAGETLLVLRLGDAAQYAAWKQAAGPAARPVSGVGVEGFQFKVPRSLCARSAATAACATPDHFLKTPRITDEHLRTLVQAAL